MSWNWWILIGLFDDPWSWWIFSLTRHTVLRRYGNYWPWPMVASVAWVFKNIHVKTDGRTDGWKCEDALKLKRKSHVHLTLQTAFFYFFFPFNNLKEEKMKPIFKKVQLSFCFFDFHSFFASPPINFRRPLFLPHLWHKHFPTHRLPPPPHTSLTLPLTPRPPPPFMSVILLLHFLHPFFSFT